MSNAQQIAADIFANASKSIIRAQKKTGSWDLTCEDMAEVEHILGRLPRIAEVREIEKALTALL